MINFEIDTFDLSQEFQLTRKDIDSLLSYTVQEVTATFAYLWEGEARSILKKTRNQYIRAIQIDNRGPFIGIAYLNPAAWIANAVELGADRFDMKPGMLASPKAKTGAKGKKYITIPFRFATPDAIGDNEIFSDVMPEDIYKAAKIQQQVHEQGDDRKGLRLSGIKKEYQIPKSMALREQMKSGNFDKRKNKNAPMTSIYEGLQRAAKGSGWITFRRVSENSDARSFIHPGIEAMNLADKALSRLDIPHIVDMSIDNFLSKL